MKQVDWFARKFDFTSQQQVFPALLERLVGTPGRIEKKLQRIDAALYPVKADGKWSILEHVGHMADLEPLWQGRLEDILAGREELRPTDLSNRKTDEANHNARGAAALVHAFTALRETTIARLEALTEDQLFLSSLHPRLRTPMRTVDLFLFVAEHDDHHLAKMTEIHRMLLKP